MNLDQARLTETTKIVRGCPCYKEFGESLKEKVCLNNDDVVPIRAISIDPSFFNKISSRNHLQEFESSNATMCYLVTFLDRNDGYCYCVSQNRRIRINNQDVKVSDIDSALQFVTSLEKSRDGVLCSDCLYRYIRTLGESSEKFLTSKERAEIIATYVREISNQVAMQLSGLDEIDEVSKRDIKRHLQDYTRELNRSRSHWTSMIGNMKRLEADSDLVHLIEAYGTLSKLESIFLFQVQSLDDESEDTDPLDVLRFMVNISEKVIDINDDIREKTNSLMERGVLPENIQEMLKMHSHKRKNTEYRFSNLASVLHEISSHAT